MTPKCRPLLMSILPVAKPSWGGSDGSAKADSACSYASKACLKEARLAVGGQQAWPSMVGASKVHVMAYSML
jgi:hypothetical protein